MGTPPYLRGGLAIFKMTKKGGDEKFSGKRGGKAKRGGLTEKGGVA